MCGDALALRISTFCTSGFSGAHRAISPSRSACTDGFSELAVVFLDWPQENARTRKIRIHGQRVLQLLDRAVVPGQMELPAVVRAEDERERAQILAQGVPMELARCRLQVT